MSSNGNAARRSKDRERRRAAQSAGDDPARESGAVGTAGHSGAMDSASNAARTAVAAAAVGAAVGAVRALATRTGPDGSDASEPDDVADAAADREHMPAGVAQQPDDADDEGEEDEEDTAAARREPRRGAAPEQVRSIVDRARDQLRDLHGREPESVSSLERIADGWRVTFEVVEVERVPNSTDVLATFVVELAGDGELLCYERLRRYYRAQADLSGDQ